jgi:hypothetical protein
MRSVSELPRMPKHKAVAAINGLRLATARQKARKGNVRRLRAVMYPRMQRPSKNWWPLRPSTARLPRIVDL